VGDFTAFEGDDIRAGVLDGLEEKMPALGTRGAGGCTCVVPEGDAASLAEGGSTLEGETG
jgi:hypothetical protein